MKITYRTKSLVWSLRKLAAQGLCVVTWEHLTRVHTMFVWQCRSHRNGGERPELEPSPMVPVHSLEGLSGVLYTISPRCRHESSRLIYARINSWCPFSKAVRRDRSFAMIAIMVSVTVRAWRKLVRVGS